VPPAPDEMRDIIQARHVASHNVRRARTHIQLFLSETPKVSGLRSMVDRADHTSWLPFLDTYRTMCLAPQPDFRRVLEDVRAMQLAA